MFKLAMFFWVSKVFKSALFLKQEMHKFRLHGNQKTIIILWFVKRNTKENSQYVTIWTITCWLLAERGKAGSHEPPLFPLPCHILAFDWVLHLEISQSLMIIQLLTHYTKSILKSLINQFPRSCNIAWLVHDFC